jgi:hypothetical protein
VVLRGRRVVAALAFALALVAGMAACGDDDDDAAESTATTASAAGSGSATTAAAGDADADTDTTAAGDADAADDDDDDDAAADDGTATSAASAATTSAGGGSSGGGAGDRCPLTAEEVGDVIGVEVAEEGGACLFYPTNGKLVPSALYVQQVAFACREDIRSEVGYEEAVDGFGVDAYVQEGGSSTTTLLVCTDPPFEVTVEGVDEGESREMAEELVRYLLAG